VRYLKYRPLSHCKILCNMYTRLCKNINYLPFLYFSSVHTMTQRKSVQNLRLYLAPPPPRYIYCVLSFKDIRTDSWITFAKFPSFSWQHSAQFFTKFAVLLLQSRDCGYDILDEYLHLHLSESQKHTDLRTHEFSHFPNL
jgi:hypothetical protein